METKKISFVFLKTKKQDKPIITEKKEYIECMEEKSIKVVGGDVIEEKAPLVIQMKPNTLITAERLKQIADKVENFEDEERKTETVQTQNEIPENESLEQMAARELLEEAKKKEVVDAPKLVVSIPALPVIEGKKESTLDDYESVPIQDFGMAMLRGMGWTPAKELSKYKQPQLRPKGLGLGADKVVKENQKKSSKENDEDLAIVKKALVKVTMGKYAGFYGQVVSLDEENGRAMVDIPIKKETVSLSEFMMHPVSKSEYDTQSKVINADTYEEYKKKENNTNTRSKLEKGYVQKNSSDKKNVKEEKHSNRSRNIDREDKSKKHRSNEYSSDSDRSPSHKIKPYQEEKSKNQITKRGRFPDNRKNELSGKYSINESRSSSDSNYRPRRQSPSRDNYRIEKTSKYSNETRDNDSRKKLKYSSNESLNSTESNCRRRSSSSSEPRRQKKTSKTSKEKKDIDKKRKGKKKKRDRDRSPYYKKCRK